MIKKFSISVKPNPLAEPVSPKIFTFRVLRNNEKTYLKMYPGTIVITTTHPNIPKYFSIQNDEVIGYKNMYGQKTTTIAVFNLKSISKDSAIYQNDEFTAQFIGRFLTFYLYDENNQPITTFSSVINLNFDIQWDSQAF